jgi:WD40 repeat protein
MVTLIHDRPVDGVAFRPRDGKGLASASWDGTIRMWDGVTGQELLRLNAVGSSPLSVAFSPDGNRLATASNGQVNVFDAITGQQTLSLPEFGTFYGVAFSPDGKRLAAAMAILSDGKHRSLKECNGTVWVWDTREPEEPSPVTWDDLFFGVIATHGGGGQAEGQTEHERPTQSFTHD